MSHYLDREGIFKARALSWSIRTSEQSASVAVTIEFAILAQLDGDSWVDWTSYEEHRVFGDFFIVKRDGGANIKQVEQLAASLRWDGSLRTIRDRLPPDVAVQITVKSEVYNGKTRYRAEWINPGDYTPQPRGADSSTIDSLDARFGSFLRAAAAGAPKPAPKQEATKMPPPAAKPPTQVQDGEIPF